MAWSEYFVKARMKLNYFTRMLWSAIFDLTAWSNQRIIQFQRGTKNDGAYLISTT